MNIGLIAHDNKKKLMENLCIAYRHILCKHDIYATGTTGRLVEEAANLVVHKYLSAHLGGEQQMGAQIINNDIDLMNFPARSRFSACVRIRGKFHSAPVRYAQYSSGNQPCNGRGSSACTGQRRLGLEKRNALTPV